MEGDPNPAILEIGGNGEVLRPSRLFIDCTTGIVATRKTASSLEVPYLKMRLKNPDATIFKPDPGLAHHLCPGAEAALAALYLSAVIRHARRLISRREYARLANVDVSWEINLSVPAQYQDEGVADRFRSVGEVALLWSDGDEPSPETVSALCRRYDAADHRRALVQGAVSVFPEIVAALHTIIGRRDTPNGIHGFVDIGGGTVDCCIFRLHRLSGGAEINILSANVESLGSMAVAKSVLSQLVTGTFAVTESKVETALIALPDDSPIVRSLPLEHCTVAIETLIHKLLISAKEKCYHHVLRQDISCEDTYRATIKSGDRFALHCCGGGIKSMWYKKSIRNTYNSRKLRSFGVMPYDLSEMQNSSTAGLDLPTHFHRTVIAYGLSHAREDLKETHCRLPREVETGVLPRQRGAAAPDYLSSKELT